VSNCKDCRFWEQNSPGSPRPLEGNCSREDANGYPEAKFRILAESRYGSSEVLRTSLITMADFGCKEWASK
jgi:hypothetical protein